MSQPEKDEKHEHKDIQPLNTVGIEMADINGDEINRLQEGNKTPRTHEQQDPFCKFHKLTLNIHDHEQTDSKKNLILLYNFIILGYIGIQLGLLSANFQSQDFIEANYYAPFHFIEFWAIFCFTIMESLILFITGNLTTDDWMSTIQTVVLLFNVVFSLIPAILFSLYPEFYEVPSHYLEYSIQILITSIDFIFIFKSSSKNDNKTYYYSKMAFAIGTFCLSIFQILVYAEAFSVGIEAERAAHFCEFSNESANGCFALWYGFEMYSKYKDDLQCHEQSMKAIAISTIV